MPKLISDCPVCGTKLKIAALHCAGCGLELRNHFELGPFDSLSPEQTSFLTAFLRQRGNMSSLQNELGISYPAAKRKLDDLLAALHLSEDRRQEPQKIEDQEVPDMSAWPIQKDGKKASDIIKRKLVENGGRAVVHSARGLPCEIRAASDGVSFLSDKLPIKPPYRYEVFDVIVDLLASQGGRAKKGNGRNHKLGEPECDETTVVGVIGSRYAHVEKGKSVYDPVFVLAAVLEWAGIANNERGELVLTAGYQSLCGEEDGEGR